MVQWTIHQDFLNAQTSPQPGLSSMMINDHSIAFVRFFATWLVAQCNRQLANDYDDDDGDDEKLETFIADTLQ